MKVLGLSKFPEGPLGTKYRELFKESTGHSYPNSHIQITAAQIMEFHLSYWSENSLNVKGFGGISNAQGNI